MWFNLGPHPLNLPALAMLTCWHRNLFQVLRRLQMEVIKAAEVKWHGHSIFRPSSHYRQHLESITQPTVLCFANNFKMCSTQCSKRHTLVLKIIMPNKLKDKLKTWNRMRKIPLFLIKSTIMWQTTSCSFLDWCHFLHSEIFSYKKLY